MKYQLFKLLQPIVTKLLQIYKKISDPPIPNLRGEREIEYSFINAFIPTIERGKALDFGASSSSVCLTALRKGYHVTALDLTAEKGPFLHQDLAYVQGDIFKLDIPLESYDLIINCSSIEHVGLAGRYGVREAIEDGDIKAMGALYRILKQKGRMLLTIPVGKDNIFPPLHRVYGVKRLPLLLQNWSILQKEFWFKKDNSNLWVQADENTVLSLEPKEYFYGLGLFVLTKSENA